jgi:two-component system response regulator AtoC
MKFNVLVVDDEKNIRESIQRLLELEGISSSLAGDGKTGAALLSEESFDAVVLDLKMPVMDGQELLEWIRGEGLRTPVIMISALGDINDAVRALKTGANDYLLKPFDPTELVLRLRSAVDRRRLEDLVEAGTRLSAAGTALVGDSPAIRSLRLLVEKAALGDATVLVTGESGTGKEVVAREIHAKSPNAAEPFVAVNIGAIQESLVESELFGHEKGAFTGADSRKPGLFELAERGTLFLDEIGETSLSLQVKFLRVLQDRKIRHLGGVRDIPIGARIISATNRNIESLVRNGTFRQDLYYRLNVVRIDVPPLRERREDIPLLAGHFLEKIRARTGRQLRTLAPDALEALRSYPFPGNVRELENLLERACIVSEDNQIMAADLDLGGPRTRGEGSALGASGEGRPAATDVAEGDQSSGAASFPNGSPAVGHAADATKSPLKPMAEIERDAIVRALEKWKGNRTRAAAELGVSRRTILNKIKQYRL